MASTETVTPLALRQHQMEANLYSHEYGGSQWTAVMPEKALAEYLDREYIKSDYEVKALVCSETCWCKQ